MSAISERALTRAIGQIGQKENPEKSNWGHPVQDYLSSVGIGFPASWCMAFVYWCFSDAALQLGVENPLFKTGGVLAQWHNRIGNQIHLIIDPTGKLLPRLTPPGKLLPGDIMIMDHGHGLGHTGIVKSVNPDGSLNTVEGNTNDSGGREGIEVAEKLRHLNKPIIGFLRF